jgi:hypothetical protein
MTTTFNRNERFSPFLFDYIKKKINLSEYLSVEIGCHLNWYEPGLTAGCICPMPNHKDGKPSFRIKYLEKEGFWVLNCLGCGAHGTILEFCRDYYNLRNKAEAVLFLCDKYGYKKTDQIVMDGLKDVKKTINLQKKIDCAHVVASRQCFYLLKKNYKMYNSWVKDAYDKMNKALDSDDIDAIESIGFEASNKMTGAT